MGKKAMMFGLACVCVLSLLVACEENLEPAFSADTQAVTGADHAGPEDFFWDSSQVTQIVLNGSAITVDGDGATAEGSTVTVFAAGTYSVSGSLVDGQIIVNTQDDGIVRLILNGVDIASAASAPIYVANAAETVIVLEDNTENHVSDATTYVFENADTDEPNAAIFSNDDLTIDGSGTLTVDGNYNDGIASEDGLVITGGTIIVNAVDDGIRGKDYLVVNEGDITVNAQGDGLKSDNADDTTQGYITIESGVIRVTSGGDAIQAATGIMIANGEFVLSAGGGSSNRIAETASAKGIKAAVSVQIDGGTFTIDTADDAIHSNDSMVINGGTFLIATGDDGMHADSSLDINQGAITITKSYEGIESAVITITGGDIHITASDDGLNVAGGNDGSGMNPGPGRGGGGPGGRGGPGQDAFAVSGDYYLTITGGYIALDADGDGIDVNGSIEMSGGVVIVNGPTANMNGALDCDGWFNVTGGFLVATGSAGMAEAPDESSTQNSLLVNFNAALQAGTLVHVQSSDGTAILTFSPTKVYQSLAFSSPALTTGATYTVYVGGSASGAVIDSLYQDSTYAPGTQVTTITLSGVVTRIGDRVR